MSGLQGFVFDVLAAPLVALAGDVNKSAWEQVNAEIGHTADWLHCS